MALRVHVAMQHALDQDFIIREGVEDDMLAQESRPVANSHSGALLAVFGFRAALSQAVIEPVEIAVGLPFAPVLEAVDPDLAQVCLRADG